MCSSTRGYTLLELCIVLAIIALMAGMAVPLFRNMAKEEVLWSQVRNIRAAASESRRTAIETGQSQILKIDVTGLRTADSARPAGPVMVETWDSRGRQWRPALVEWLFLPSGLCDPLSLRFRSADGWIEEHFSPLTATVGPSCSRRCWRLPSWPWRCPVWRSR